MKKRFLPLSLALALSMGLVSPALAFDPPAISREGFEDVTLSYTLQDDVACNVRWTELGSATWVGGSGRPLSMSSARIMMRLR